MEKQTNWQCKWCHTPEPGRLCRKGPDGPHTLCDGCGQRYNAGQTQPGVPLTKWKCSHCERRHTPGAKRYVGPNGPQTLCHGCGAKHCKGVLMEPSHYKNW